MLGSSNSLMGMGGGSQKQYTAMVLLDEKYANSNKKIDVEEPKTEVIEEKEEVQSTVTRKSKNDEFLIVVNENSIIYKVKKFIKKIINKWKKEK